MDSATRTLVQNLSPRQMRHMADAVLVEGQKRGIFVYFAAALEAREINRMADQKERRSRFDAALKPKDTER